MVPNRAARRPVRVDSAAVGLLVQKLLAAPAAALKARAAQAVREASVARQIRDFQEKSVGQEGVQDLNDAVAGQIRGKAADAPPHPRIHNDRHRREYRCGSS